MSTENSSGLQRSATKTEESTIEGPITEYDCDGTPTGYNYYRCSGCGVEAMRRRDLCDGGCTCKEGRS